MNLSANAPAGEDLKRIQDLSSEIIPMEHSRWSVPQLDVVLQ